jgi:hypothetical protein
MDEDEHDRILDVIRKLNPKQREIILGKIATLQAFDDDEASVRWIERNRNAILSQLNDAE